MSLTHELKRHLHKITHYYYPTNERFYSTKIDWKELRPMILKRVRNRARQYPVKNIIPVAEEVIKSREELTCGVASLLKIIPVHSCKFCPEVYVGPTGHGLKSCPGFKRVGKDRVHRWVRAGLPDVLAPVETYHLLDPFHRGPIDHKERFNFERIPAVMELCYQAGADLPESSCSDGNDIPIDANNHEEITSVANTTLEAWERLRLGVQKLLFVYPAKVCRHCSEVHVGPSGHKVRTCGMYANEAWKGAHMWRRAELDDLIPEKIVWHRRPQDPDRLVDEGRGFYGHAPAVVELCYRAGARVPDKYFCMMKVHGLAPMSKVE